MNKFEKFFDKKVKVIYHESNDVTRCMQGYIVAEDEDFLTIHGDIKLLIISKKDIVNVQVSGVSDVSIIQST